MIHHCNSCGSRTTRRIESYRYKESGLSNVVLHGVELRTCAKCGEQEIALPRMISLHRAIAEAIVNSPGKLTGEQFRYLRKHLGMSGEDIGKYLHTDRTKISKWERGEDPIGPASDRLMRMVASTLDSSLRRRASSVARNLPNIADRPGSDWELHVDPQGEVSFVPIAHAA